MTSRDELTRTTRVQGRAGRGRLRTGIVTRAAAAAVVLGALAMAAAACDSQTAQDPTPVKTFKITPAPGGATSVPSAAATPTATAGAPASSNVLELTASGQTLKFDKDKLAAPAGPVTIRFDNRDAGVVHNVHVFKGTDAKGESVGQT